MGRAMALYCKQSNHSMLRPDYSTTIDFILTTIYPKDHHSMNVHDLVDQNQSLTADQYIFISMTSLLMHTVAH